MNSFNPYNNLMTGCRKVTSTITFLKVNKSNFKELSKLSNPKFVSIFSDMWT